jgi:RNA polymerase sigma factor (sigma-70 family)
MMRKRSGGANDRDRFETIYRGTRQALLAYLLRRTDNADDAADLLSEIYLIAWRRIDDVPPGEEARLWLFGVARKVLAGQRRRASTATALALALERSLPIEGSGQSTFDSRIAVEEITTALRTLAPADRELLMLSGWEGLSPSEIGVVIGRPAALVRVRLHRARARLRARLAEDASALGRDHVVRLPDLNAAEAAE